MFQIDLNCDLGESFGSYTIGLDEEVIPFVSSVNIACGWHAGDPLIMDQTVLLAKKYQVAVGAHPGFPDLMGFGRRNLNITPKEAKAYVKYQVGALMAFCNSYQIKMQHVKPHGALYNMAGKNFNLARGICEGIYEINSNLILLGLAGSEMIYAAKQIGLPFAQEVFADRAYDDDGSLVNRNLPGAVISDPEIAIQRVIKMIKEGKVISIHGKEIDLQPDSICVHGDNQHALEFVKKINQVLAKNEIEICAISKIV